jgi:uncharacterized membrane protein (DUF2068 family)
MFVRRSAVQTTPAKQRFGRSSSFVLTLIAIFKLAKALLLIVGAIGALKLLHKDVASTVEHWVRALRVDPDNRFMHRLLVKVPGLTPARLKELSIGTFIYAGLFSIEGVGLLLRKRWAEYFTIITTGLLIPIEVYEAVRHFTPVKALVLLANVLIVLYLIHRVRSLPSH